MALAAEKGTDFKKLNQKKKAKEAAKRKAEKEAAAAEEEESEDSEMHDEEDEEDADSEDQEDNNGVRLHLDSLLTCKHIAYTPHRYI